MASNASIIKWVSYGLQGIISLMFLMGAVMNIIGDEKTVKQSEEMGYPESSLLYLGLLLAISVLLYLLPKTSILGALLITAWLGGAVATHVIHRDPLVNTLFPVLFGLVIWIVLWLRDDRLKTIFPLRS